MSFPKKILFFSIGWKDRGSVGGIYAKENVNTYTTHTYCNTIIHIGKEEGEIFKFCPLCLLKIED